MTILVYSDLHLGTQSPAQIDELVSIVHQNDPAAIFVLGDVVDDNRDHAKSASDGERYEQEGRAFLERLDAFDVSVVAVPGNHDPVSTMDRLIDGLPNVASAHERVVTGAPGGQRDQLPVGAVVGSGCEQFDQTTGLAYREFPSLDPTHEATADDIHHLATQSAESIEAAVGKFLVGRVSVGTAADELGVEARNRSRFEERLVALRASFETLATLLERAPSPTVLLSHQPPFNTALDHHHADRGIAGRLHRGSIALKMAILHTGPELALSGHTHVCRRDAIETAHGYTTAYNPGSPGVARIVSDATGESFRIERVDVSWG